MNKKDSILLFIRYLVLIVIAIPNLYIIYLIATPLTVYPVFYFLKFLYNAQLLAGNTILFNGIYTEIINACIAGAAYYLLIILNLTTPMKVKTRVKSLIFLIGIFLILNILRITLFAFLLNAKFPYFDLTHEVTWYFGSTIIVIAVWFFNVYLFKIKGIPIYSDFKKIIREIKR